jgi:hypothetical protein
MPEYKPSRPVGLMLALDDEDGRSIGVIATRDETFRSNSMMCGYRYQLVAKEGEAVVARGSVIGSLGDTISAAQEMLADVKAQGPYRPRVELHPLRGSVGLPSGPAISTPSIVRYTK